MGLLFFYAAMVVGVSFVCSLLESVILSVDDTYVRQLQKNKKNQVGDILAHLRREIDRPLAAILTLNTVVNTAGSAGVGIQTLKLYGNAYVAVASGLLTFCILIISEIIPKVLGAMHWRRLVPFATYTSQGLIFLLYPFVMLAEVVGDGGYFGEGK